MEIGTVTTVKKYFERDSTKPLKATEMVEFWESLTDEEKIYYRTAAYELMQE